MRSLMMAISMGTTTITSLGIAEGAPLDTTLNSGAKVVVTGSSGSWTRIKIGNSKDCYISTRFLK